MGTIPPDPAGTIAMNAGIMMAACAPNGVPSGAIIITGIIPLMGCGPRLMGCGGSTPTHPGGTESLQNPSCPISAEEIAWAAPAPDEIWRLPPSR